MNTHNSHKRMHFCLKISLPALLACGGSLTSISFKLVAPKEYLFPMAQIFDVHLVRQILCCFKPLVRSLIFSLSNYYATPYLK